MSMRALITIPVFDTRTLMRDNFLVVVALITAFMLAALGAAGHYREALGIAHWQPWIQYVLIMFLITNVGTYGMLFGLVLVEEVETKVRAALMVVPVGAVMLTLLRTMTVTIWLCVQPFLFVAVVASAWDAVSFGPWPWLWLSMGLAPLGAVFMIILSTVASNRVEALAMGKFYSAATAPPMLLFLIAPDAWFRHIFLLFPTTPFIYAFQEFSEGTLRTGSMWIGGGVIYALALLILATRRFIRRSYMITS